jgi:rubrerythrin
VKEIAVMELKGSRTEHYLMMAFVGESVARNRYTFFSSQARKEGYVQIAQAFEEAANQEKEHAKTFFKLLPGGEVKIECAFSAGVIGTTLDNLRASTNGENEEGFILYPSFAKVARTEGFESIVVIFDKVALAEKQHERRFRGLLENLENGRVFRRDQPVKWRCLNCGYVHEGSEAPTACPACNHPQAYFEVLVENW